MILERLARRLDYDLIASHIPEGDRKLIVHIRKEQLRKHRLKAQSEAGSQVGHWDLKELGIVCK